MSNSPQDRTGQLSLIFFVISMLALLLGASLKLLIYIALVGLVMIVFAELGSG